ncbi:MAG: nicotinate (nicotinamide) nucleotide adenylyltransferase [Ruminococcaceae bacterium]|nr:nicotinate (nicotinamide) nucleotide adenylyltransferase [Oscillospiraceae bacterium]
MSAVAMFGGSFNPVHWGHKAMLLRMIEEFALDTVYVIPTFCTPLKDNTPMITPEHRLNMCRIAFSDVSSVIVSDMEILRQGKSYTAHTLRELHTLHPQDELFLIVGADSFMQLPMWYNVGDILSLATVLTIARGEYDYNELLTQKDLLESQYNAKAFVIREPVVQVSSTQIRNLISADKPFAHLLPEGVSEYIKESGLYGYGCN